MRRNLHRFILLIIVVFVLFSVGCSAQTEEQALAQLRQLTADGKLPPETLVTDIESRFAGKRTGALAKLLHARIRFEQNDFAGAAALLNTDVFQKKTKLGDYALWLRGKALQGAGNHAEAMSVFNTLIKEYPDSIRIRDARLAWATSAIATGQAVNVPPMLIDLSLSNDADAFLLMAKAYEAQGDKEQATNYYRRAYLLGMGSVAARDAATKIDPTDKTLSLSLTKDQAVTWADRLLAAKRFQDAADAYLFAVSNFRGEARTPRLQLNRMSALIGASKFADAEAIFRGSDLAIGSAEREEAYRQLVLGYAKAKQWPQAKTFADDMRFKYPNGKLVAKTFIDAGLAARDQKNSDMEGYFLNTAVAAFPNSVDVAQAQFEAAWFQHEGGNFALSSQGFIDHLARYTDKDTTNRGKAGYWAARDSQRAGKLAEACTLYEGVLYRYGANWYGYLALDRLTAMKSAGQCTSRSSDPTIAKAVANLRTVTVAAETAGDHERERIAKSDELSIVGLFDWAIDELNEAKKTAASSPSINLALARHYRWKGDNTSALVAMQKSYPDYAQMFPEEMDREAWAFFYPLSNWNDIKKWSAARGLDAYQVAGFIRQETVFTVRAKSPANAYGLMQLLLPTAKTTAKKYGSSFMPTSAEDLYNPSLNIELGTAFLKDMYEKFGRVEYVSVAYNAGPNRVPQWRATLPAEIDEFAEAIPFKETKQYVQGIIRNSAQYRRLYDENGNWKANVGTRPLRGEIDSKPREQVIAENPDLIVEDSGSTGEGE